MDHQSPKVRNSKPPAGGLHKVSPEWIDYPCRTHHVPHPHLCACLSALHALLLTVLIYNLLQRPTLSCKCHSAWKQQSWKCPGVYTPPTQGLIAKDACCSRMKSPARLPQAKANRSITKTSSALLLGSG